MDATTSWRALVFSIGIVLIFFQIIEPLLLEIDMHLHEKVVYYFRAFLSERRPEISTLVEVLYMTWKSVNQ